MKLDAIKPSRVWTFGDDVDTDALAPGRYMAAPLEILSAHCLENLAPEFAANVQAGDIIVAGRNFGAGSSREQAPQALRFLGIRAVIAQSFAGIFHRNAINIGLPVLRGEAHGLLQDGDTVRLDVESARLFCEQTGREIDLKPLPAFLLELLHDGGLIPHLEKKLLADASTGEPQS
jgi:3-isopropylmalate/(R)-2-methylmalate dehydratase small subunit